MQASETGLKKIWGKLMYGSVRKEDVCFRSLSSPPSNNKSPLTLNNMSSAFLLLGVGYAIALIVLAGELAIKNRFKHF